MLKILTRTVLVNIPVADQPMLLTWLSEYLRAETPHVVLELVDEQGSAKSSTQRALRRLIDPNKRTCERHRSQWKTCGSRRATATWSAWKT